MTAPLFTWEIRSVTTDALGQIVVETQGIVTNPDGTEAEHSIVIPPAAIGARMALYGLATPQEALDAILREHGCRVSPDITLPATPTTAADFGGTSDAVAIDHADSTVSTQIDSTVADHQDVIDAAAAARWDEPRYVELRDGGGVPTPPPPTLPPALPPPAQSPTAVAQTMAEAVHSALDGVADNAPASAVRDALKQAMAPYLPPPPA